MSNVVDDRPEVVPKPVAWGEWADDSTRIVATRLLGGPTETSIVNVADGTSSLLDVGMEIEHAFWRPGHDQLLFSVPAVDAYRAYYLVNADGSDLQRIEGVSARAINDPTVSPDGSKLAYATGGSGDGTGEDIHVLEIATGKEPSRHLSMSTPYLDVAFSPDGDEAPHQALPLGGRGRVGTARPGGASLP